jgi:hypothetical protein
MNAAVAVVRLDERVVDLRRQLQGSPIDSGEKKN